MISNIHRNIMGTISFDLKAEGMRKAQEFIVYPMRDKTECAVIQSDTRFGYIQLATGAIVLTPSIKGGAYGHHISLARPAGALTGEQRLLLLAQIASTSGLDVGRERNGVIGVDNSAAIGVLG